MLDIGYNVSPIDHLILGIFLLAAKNRIVGTSIAARDI